MVHELGQLAGTKEFFNRSNNRTNVDQSLRRNNLNILNRHSFLNNALHTGKTYTELILQQFTNTADTTVSKMIDVIRITKTIHQVQQIAERSKNIFCGNCAVFFMNIGSKHQLHRLTFHVDHSRMQSTIIINTALFDFVDSFFTDFYTGIQNYFTCRSIYKRFY